MDYFQLLRQNRFRIHITKYPMFFLIGGCSFVNSSFALLQRLLWSKKIANARLEQPPIFIIGHWRSGTTLMHELITLDETKTYPTNYQAFVPHHFLVTSTLFSPLVNLLMPKRRPMDDMALTVSAPQEDDFALISMGAPTPYRKFAFSKSRSNDHLQLNLELADPTVIEKVKNTLQYFFRALTLKESDKQLVLKSPPHTGRIKQLSEWFPGAKFIHMSRHPHKMVPSTIRTWKLLEDTQGFQYNREPQHWKEYVFTCKDLMYDAYSAFKSELPANQLVEVQFEELIKNPQQEVGRVYEQLELEGEDLMEKVTKYFERTREHSPHRNPLDEELKTEIDRHWESYLKEFGYDE